MASWSGLLAPPDLAHRIYHILRILRNHLKAQKVVA